MQFPIIIGLHRLLLLDTLLFVAAGLASFAVSVLPLASLQLAALVLTIWLTAALAWYRLKPRLHSIRLEKDGRISARFSDETGFEVAELLPGATVHPWITVFRLKISTTGKVETVIFVPPAIFGASAVNQKKRQILRKLRVVLRWQSSLIDGRESAV